MRKKSIGATAVALGVAGVTLLGTGSAGSHGYTDSPISRQKLCANGTVSNCGNIQWEPQSVEGLKGFPAAGPADGKICAGGNAPFAQLDDPRGGTWPATSVTAGQSYNFRWQFTARHRTTDFKYYITKNGWNPSQPLTRAALDPQPFLTVPYNNQQPPATLSHSGNLPAGKTGRHLILAVWTVADTANAFYACSDVKF
ncbi:lytic polysaccharide monooxygenase [Streptomyces sp. NPDC090109]|uniref:lytic polysaccharide monooxygenase auxiliary activity family 9 protein n=1 Tax=Streptomyces TaxID=1883 RepID=UPI000EF786DC|nr:MULTISPECIES: lytic polysaccharide monooxygenase [unclassified Streptomyces]MZE56011.1 chitin-binding protein [Streptomyces sp. SID5770]